MRAVYAERCFVTSSSLHLFPQVFSAETIGAPGEFHHPGLGLGLRFRVTVRVSVRVRDRVRDRGGEILRERRNNSANYTSSKFNIPHNTPSGTGRILPLPWTCIWGRCAVS